MQRRFYWMLAGCAVTGVARGQESPPVVGLQPDGACVPTAQLVRPAGETLAFEGRPVDLCLSPDGSRLFVKDDAGLVVLDTSGWALLQRLPFPGEVGGSVHGIAVSPDGRAAFLTDAANGLHEARLSESGVWAWARRVALPGPNEMDKSFPCGVALDRGRPLAYVCLSRSNTLGVVDLSEGKPIAEIPVGIAPFAVVIPPGQNRAFVSNWGGRRPRQGDQTEQSSGTPVVVDGRGIAASGTVSVVDLAKRATEAEIDAGLHPTGVSCSADGSLVLVACANSDQVCVIDAAALRVRATIDTRPDPALPRGSSPEAAVLSTDGQRLYVANAGTNALAVFNVAAGLDHAHMDGLIPTGWYPGALALRDDTLFVANVKGLGSRAGKSQGGRLRVQDSLGTISRVAAPQAHDLEAMTARVRHGAIIEPALESRDAGAPGAAPVPVPRATGQPSVFRHVVYVIKENRTYDQVFGDMGKGNSDPSLCIYGREITPNQHALADQFALLDNFYCNGVKSSDGHAWVCEGNAVDYIELMFGGFIRNYDYGDDPLGMSATGAIWDHVLAKGLTFRNYGEVDYPRPERGATYAKWLESLKAGQPLPTFRQRIPIKHIREHTCPTYPGWHLGIPDVVRAEAFLKELAQFETKGEFPSLAIVYLPSDHTSGTSEGHPTPRAYVADNDMALGRVVEGISKSRFWPQTCVFVVEDDPQDGFDHVDGHRSTCLVISPYTKRRAVVSQFYNQASVVHTIERILGIAPANQMYAIAPLMSGCFDNQADLTPFAALDSNVPLGELNPSKSSLRGEELRFAEQSDRLAFDTPDRADEDTLNRVLWHAARGDAPYPTELAGAHGRGLGAMGLRLTGTGAADGDDEHRSVDGPVSSDADRR